VSIVDVIGYPVAQVLKGIHSGLTKIGIPSDSGWAWGLSIVLLVICVRLILFPLFVKQIRSQRRMQEIAPKVKELQKLHKGDRETLNKEMMQLYKDNNANPIAGCLPLVLQLPVFFALFSVLREFKPRAKPRFGLSQELLTEGGRAKIFGAPISSALNSSSDFIQGLGGNSTATRIVAVIMLVTMGATTFITQRQMIARNTTTDPTQLQVQKILLYVLPFSFSIFGFSFPIGVLLYWLTTNLWSMGQQYFVIKRMPPPNLTGAPAAAKPGAVQPGSSATARPTRARRAKEPVEPVAGSVTLSKAGSAAGGAVPSEAGSPAPARTASGRPAPGGGKATAGSRKNRNKKGRPGGRR
jgi:YidC/Oxa1 family membrane protein insertase